jgi:multidrug efflux system membrane fusion protein
MSRLALPLLCLALAASCSNKAQPQKDERQAKRDLKFPVEVAKVEVRAVEYVIEAVGSLDAFETVQVTARVAGAVDRVRFREGDVVKRGTVLVAIEPGRYTLAVERAQASLGRAVAARADAERGFERRQKMSVEGVASVEELETYRTKLETTRADESAARAERSLAELNLRDAYVTAPIDGTVQTRTVQTGQYLQPGAVMATLARRDPLLLRFKIAEHEAPSLVIGGQARFSVRGVGEPKTATIQHVAERADDSTRMVAVVAQVDGDDGALRPGAFAQVQVPSKSAKAAVVPQTAVRPSDRGFLVFVVRGGRAVELVVQLGRRTADGFIEVASGLREGEEVVVRGAEALTNGVSLSVAAGPSTTAPAPSAAASSQPSTGP